MTDAERKTAITEALESFTPIAVEYSVTLPGRKQTVTDKDGKPTDKKRPVKLPIPATIYEGDFDQWTALYEALGLDPQEQFAHFVNAAFKQGNESLKGDLRAIVVEEAKKLDTKSNKAALEIVGKREKVVKAIESFATACKYNVPTKPVKVESEKRRALETVQKIEGAAPGLVAKLAAMTPEQLAAFLEAAAKEGEQTDA